METPEILTSEIFVWPHPRLLETLCYLRLVCLSSACLSTEPIQSIWNRTLLCALQPWFNPLCTPSHHHYLHQQWLPPCCLLCLTFPYSDLALQQTKRTVVCLIWYSAGEWTGPFICGFCVVHRNVSGLRYFTCLFTYAAIFDTSVAWFLDSVLMKEYLKWSGTSWLVELFYYP